MREMVAAVAAEESATQISVENVLVVTAVVSLTEVEVVVIVEDAAALAVIVEAVEDAVALAVIVEDVVAMVVIAEAAAVVAEAVVYATRISVESALVVTAVVSVTVDKLHVPYAQIFTLKLSI